MAALVIINNAIFSTTFMKVAEKLNEIGMDVIIVTDSMFTQDKFKLSSLGLKIYNFEEYSCENPSNAANGFWNIHSDYDRDNYYNSINANGNYWAKNSSRLTSFFESIFKRETIDFIFYENVSNGLAQAAYEVGKAFCIPYYGLTSSRMPQSALFTSIDSDLAESITKFINTDFIIPEEESNYLDSYIKNIETIQPDYMKTNGLSSTNFVKKVFKKRKMNHIIKTLLSFFESNENSFQIGSPLRKTINFNMREIKRFFNAKIINKYYKHDFDDKKFYLYPLHFHPESSTSILARFYDEFNLIKNISFSLSENEYLVVKDHLSAFGYESAKFYKKISELPNVILARPDLNAKTLVNKSLGVITLTSTVGYEAIIMDKPVVTFGEVFYNNHPLVFHAKGYADITSAFNFIKNNTKQSNLHREYTKKFLYAYKSLGFNLVINHSGGLSEQSKSAEVIVNNLIKKHSVGT